MTATTTQPILTQEGILFTVVVDSVGRDCIVTSDALQVLSQLKPVDDNDADMLELFHAYEAHINGVAKRLCAARVPGNPLRMTRATFNAPYTA